MTKEDLSTKNISKRHYLEVKSDGQLIGYLYDTDPLSFQYSEKCLHGSVTSPLETIIPIEPGEINSPGVHAYFENLLPESDQRQLLSDTLHINSVFGLLSSVAWDSAGAIDLATQDFTNTNNEYIHATWQELAQMISGQLPMPQVGLKSTISGAQYKILLSIDPMNQHPKLPIGSSVTTHILKPEIQRVGQKIWASSINETLLMKVAQRCGLPTSNVSYIREVKSCIVERYDRVNAEKKIAKLNQFDICQILKIPSDLKYEQDGGPGFLQCYLQVKRLSATPFKDCENLLKWLFFNLFTGNNDSHAKNISMLKINKVWKLAPFYDLMCTSVYPGFSKNFAFQIGGTYNMNEITSSHLQKFAQEIAVSDKYLIKLASEVLAEIRVALLDVIEELNNTLDYSEKVMTQRIAFEVEKNCKKMQQQFLKDELS